MRPRPLYKLTREYSYKCSSKEAIEVQILIDPPISLYNSLL